MPIGHLVCEGERGSLDVRLLDAVLAQYHRLPILIEPGGGGNHPKVIRSWFERRTPGEVALAVLDRDCRPLAEVEASWLDPTAKWLDWRRHSIENYLLEPWVIHETFTSYRRTITDE